MIKYSIYAIQIVRKERRKDLVKLSRIINCTHLEEIFGATYHPGTERPGISTGLVVSFHYLKYAYNSSLMVLQKVRLRGQSKKLQVQGAQFLRDEATLEVAAMIHPVKLALPPRFARFNRAGDAAQHRN